MPAWTAHEILCALRDRLEPEGWVILPEVRTKDGQKDRYADAIAMNLWSSRGYELAGYEFKSSRADLLRELRDPAKGEASFRRCDKWWMVLGDKSLGSLDEIPPTWGVMYPRGRLLMVARQAPRVEAVPVDRAFMASLLRRAREWQRPGEEIQILIRKAQEEERKACEDRHRRAMARLESTSKAAEEAVQQFNLAAGVSLYRSSAQSIGAEYRRGRQLLAGGSKLRELASYLSNCASHAQEMAETFRDAGRAADAVLKSEESMVDGMGI